MRIYEEEGLPPWPQMPDAWKFDETAFVPRRTSTLFIGALVFVETDTRIYRRPSPGERATGGPVYRYCFQVRRIAGETSRSWLLQASDWSKDPESWDKVPKRDLSKIYGRDDVEETIWIDGNQHKIARAIGDLRGPKSFVQLQAIAQIIGFEI